LTRTLAAYLTGLVGAAFFVLLFTSLVIPVEPGIAIQLDSDSAANFLEILVGILFWTGVTFVASAVPVQLTDGVHVAVSTAPVMAAAILGGPTAAAWVAFLGSTDLRELRGRVV
jgi:mannitol-specific phosphotransferase system IIBC component